MRTSLAFWLSDVRKTALITCITTVISLVIPMWNMTHQMFRESTYQMYKMWMISTIVLTSVFSAILPVFYFALSRNEGTLRFPKRLRLLGLVGALTSGTIIAAGLPNWIRSLGSDLALAAPMFDWSGGASNVLIFARDPRTIGQVSTLLGELSNIVYILMLVAVFRWVGDSGETDVPISGLLRVMTKVAVISWGIVVTFCLIRLIGMPFIFIQLRDVALKMGRKPPILGNMMAEATRTLMSQACLLAVPYIIYRSQRDRVESEVDAQSDRN